MRRTDYSTRNVRLEEMQALHIMETDVTTCGDNFSCEKAADTVIKQGIGSLPVVDGEGHLIGIITEFDLLKILHEGKKLEEEKVKDHMTKEVLFVEPHRPIKDIIDLLEEKHLIRVPVVDDGKLVGIITRRDVLYGVMISHAHFYTLT